MTAVGWLNDPYVLFTLVLLQFLVMVVKVSELIGKNIGVWSEVKSLSPEFFLHPNNVETHSVLASDFVGLRKLVYLLIFV